MIHKMEQKVEQKVEQKMDIIYRRKKRLEELLNERKRKNSLSISG